MTDKAGDHVTQHDARPALARSAHTGIAGAHVDPSAVPSAASAVLSSAEAAVAEDDGAFGFGAIVQASRKGRGGFNISQMAFIMLK